MINRDYQNSPCNIIIIGASGDLSRKKLIPALFSLYCNDMLPKTFKVVGFARSELSDQDYRNLMMDNLTCRYEPEKSKCDEKMNGFLSNLHYVSGQYHQEASFNTLKQRLNELGNGNANSLFYMAIPPSVFIATATSIRKTHMEDNQNSSQWSRVVLEKPFGRDSQSSADLIKSISSIFNEEQTYRIDHYLGKEVIQNLLILRFANLIFEPIWNRNFIASVSISWSEKIGCEGRAGYFDDFGIIRDVIQNHLLQIVALVAMEQPAKLEADAIADQKVKLLRCAKPIGLENMVVGQYTGKQVATGYIPGYLDDPEVPKGSNTPTYARATLYLDHPRWHDVPFHMCAGKALNTSMTEISIQFKDVPHSLYHQKGNLKPNRLVIRVQPNEAIELHVNNKMPGLEESFEPVKLNLHYASTFRKIIPEAYERLLLDVLRGDRSLFIRADELLASWDIVTPALHDLEKEKVKPKAYEFGSAGPE